MKDRKKGRRKEELPITTKVASRVGELEKEIERRDEDETKIRMGKW